MKIRVSRLRRLIREAIADTMMANTEAPPTSQDMLKQGSHPAMRNPDTKANQVAKVVNAQVGNTSMTQRVQQFVAQLDPQQRLVMTADQIAQQFLSQQN